MKKTNEAVIKALGATHVAVFNPLGFSNTKLILLLRPEEIAAAEEIARQYNSANANSFSRVEKISDTELAAEALVHLYAYRREISRADMYAYSLASAMKQQYGRAQIARYKNASAPAADNTLKKGE